MILNVMNRSKIKNWLSLVQFKLVNSHLKKFVMVKNLMIVNSKFNDAYPSC